MEFTIQPIPRRLEAALREKIDNKTKPIGALGVLEALALRIGLIQDTLEPSLNRPAIVVFAADHGITEENVSPYPSDVTRQMVRNFLQGGAAINVFAKQNQLDLKIVDAGVAGEFENKEGLLDRKIANGTRNFVEGPAMTVDQCVQALTEGADIVSALQRSGTNVVGFGDMGIGNTSSAAVLMSFLCRQPLSECVGAGSGLDAKGIGQKLEVLEKAQRRIRRVLAVGGSENLCGEASARRLLSECGGFEIVMMCGAFLRAAQLGMVTLVDGFIASAALLAARAFNAHVMDYCLFTHCSQEQGHRRMLKCMNVKPLMDLEMRLGEGSGVALAYPLIQAAVNFLNEMASFEAAEVSGRKPS